MLLMKNRHSIKFKKTASYVAIAVLVAIGLAVLISAIALRINGWFGLIITNFCTVMICWAVFQFWAKISDEQRKDDYSDLKAEEEKDRRLKDAEKENAELRRQKDLLQQAQSFFANINFHKKLSLMDKTDIGYIVRNENFDELKKDEKLAGLIEGATSVLQRKQSRNLLYIHRQRVKHNLGIDLDKIRYAHHNGKLYVQGVEIVILHNTSAEIDKETEGDVDICWVTGGNILGGGEAGIKNSDSYDKLKDAYKAKIEAETNAEIRLDTEALCRQISTRLQKGLNSRYPNVEFVSLEQAETMQNLDWKAPSQDSDMELISLMSDMHMGLNLLSGGEA